MERNKANDYNARVLADALCTPGMLTQLTEFYQGAHSLTPDGMLGPVTRNALTDDSSLPKATSPLAALPCAPMAPENGRPPVITSGHWTVNPSRKPTPSYHGHQGVDLMYRGRLATEPALRKTRRCDGTFLVPENCAAYAVINGTVLEAAEHSNGWTVVLQSAMFPDVFVYRHLQSVSVVANAKVNAGDTIGIVGHTMKTSLVHLHFEWHASIINLRYHYRDSLNPAGLLQALGISDAFR